MTELRQQFADYLEQTFGEEFLRLLDEPEGVHAGERVLYKLKRNQEARRQEPSADNLNALRETMAEIARKTGATGISFEPPVTSGLPYPRLIDLPGSSIMWDAELRKYMEADAMLPSADFPLEWVAGVLFTPSQKMLLYLDCTDSRVAAVFRVFYEGDAFTEPAATVRDRFKQFQSKKRELLAECARRRTLVWAKLVQIDDEPVWIRVKETARP